MELKMKLEILNPSVFTESNHIYETNRNRVEEILAKDIIDENESSDLLLSLHMVLEVGLTTFLRKFFKNEYGYDIANQDNLSKIDYKTKLSFFAGFVRGKTGKTVDVLNIVNDINDFSAVRNMIIHGYPVQELSTVPKVNQSKLKKNLNPISIKNQVEKYNKIVNTVLEMTDHLSFDNGGAMDKCKAKFLRTFNSNL